MSEDVCSKCGSEIGWGETCYYCATVKLQKEIKALRDSMDELLQLLKRMANSKDYGWNMETIQGAIKKAEAIKKETK